MSGEKIIKGLEDALAYAQGDKTKGTSHVYITLAIGERKEGGVYIRGMGEMRDVYVASSDKDAVFHDLGLVLQRILKENHGIEWVKDEDVGVTDSSGSVYTDIGIHKPAHGEVRRDGKKTYVWDGSLEVWIQTTYDEDE